MNEWMNEWMTDRWTTINPQAHARCWGLIRGSFVGAGVKFKPKCSTSSLLLVKVLSEIFITHSYILFIEGNCSLSLLKIKQSLHIQMTPDNNKFNRDIGVQANWLNNRHRNEHNYHHPKTLQCTHKYINCRYIMLFMAQTHCWLCHCASHKMFYREFDLSWALKKTRQELETSG